MIVLTLLALIAGDAPASDIQALQNVPPDPVHCHHPQGWEAWSSLLGPNEHRQYYPQAELAHGDTGYAVLNCHLTREGVPSRCTVTSASSKAFSLASLQIAHRFKVVAVGSGTLDPSFLENVPACLDLYWTPSGIREGAIPPIVAGPSALSGQPVASRQPTPRIVANPAWLTVPSAEDVAHAYPPSALEGGTEGKSSMECLVESDGALTTCRIVSEDPSGAGFGHAELRLASSFRMKPTLDDGTPVAGAKIVIPLTWRLGPSTSPPPAH